MNTLTSATECNICAETYNKSIRKPIECIYCHYVACLKCCKTYILDLPDPKCMNCTKTWTLSFLRHNFPNTFITTEYKKHIENVLFDKERALLPATQPIVEREIEKEALQDAIREKTELIMRERRALSSLQSELYRLINRQETTQRREFIRTCPYDNCKGYLSTQWKCNLCNNWTCSDCHEVKGPNRDAEHTCLPENIESAKIIMSETRPCPKCGIRIFKISGCDQMFCTMCNTAFSWRTGALETNIHNPHYFEWMARTGGNMERNPLDVRCGRIIDHFFIQELRVVISTAHRNIRNKYNLNNVNVKENKSHKEFMEFEKSKEKEFKDLTQICIRINHIRQIDMATYYIPDTITNNQYLRVRYMRNKISEEEFKTLIQRNEKRNKKYRDIYNIFSLFVDATTDIIYRIQDEIKNNDEYSKETFNELEQLRVYVNECFKDISYTYSCKQIEIIDNYYVLTK